MFKCKYAGDKDDTYCKDCDGIEMLVDGNKISCKECAGYEPGEDEVECADDTQTNNDPVERTETRQNDAKHEKVVNTTSKKEKPENKASTQSETHSNKNDAKKKETNVEKVSEEKKSADDKDTELYLTNGNTYVSLNPNVDEEIKVTSLRYTSGATVKKGDNYFKFIAEEEWDVSKIEDVQEAREKLWAKLNAEVDSQIEELNNMN